MELFISIGVVVSASVLTIFSFKRLCSSVKFKWYVTHHQWLQPNWISFWRTISALIAVLILFEVPGKTGFFIALTIYSISASLDAVDGMIARKIGPETEFGKWLDPFCDKVAYMVPIVIFATKGILLWYLVAALLACELFGQFIVRMILRNRGRSVAAIKVGKIKAVFCFSEVFNCSIISIGLSPFMPNLVLSVCIIFALASALFKLFPVIELSLKAKFEALVRNYAG